MTQSQRHQAEEEKASDMNPNRRGQTGQSTEPQTEAPDDNQGNEGGDTIKERTVDVTKI